MLTYILVFFIFFNIYLFLFSFWRRFKYRAPSCGDNHRGTPSYDVVYTTPVSVWPTTVSSCPCRHSVRVLALSPLSAPRILMSRIIIIIITRHAKKETNVLKLRRKKKLSSSSPVFFFFLVIFIIIITITMTRRPRQKVHVSHTTHTFVY